MSLSRGFFLLALLSIFIAATLQSGEFLVIAGVKPNLVLALLVVFSFFMPHLFPYAILALFSAFMLSFAPGISWEGGALILVALIFFYVRDRFLSPGLVASILFSVFGTVLFYLLISPTVLYDEVGVVAKEVLYNGLLAAGLFKLIGFIYEKKGGSPIR
jgi:hypothetical protein